ncbi:Abi family protein [Cellulosimicrobium cellulans]|uniref:hypothetical protein n=1 Tax=Cellulosimicrobium cellulans TaxID=1710 RepID=UPI001883800B|nr:hypothetical protein [Cellulosimicrobium cellulans]MBE9924301.1 Abi family protein [Cellulosimicrobium cellulans]
MLFAKHMAPDKNGKLEGKNATPRSQIKSASKKCGLDQPGTGAPRGKVVAELMFGFWSYLTDNLHEKTLWVPALHQAFAPGVDRSALHAALTDLRDVRNRIAHHESIFDRGVENHRRRIVYVAANLSTDMKDFIVEKSTVRELLSARP